MTRMSALLLAATLATAAAPALAQNNQHMMGNHDQGMMGNDHGQGMMGDDNGQGATGNGGHMMGDDNGQGMMGDDGHMMGDGNHNMGNGHMNGHDGQ